MFPSCVGGCRTTVLLLTRCFQQQQQFRYGLKTARFLRTETCIGRQFHSVAAAVSGSSFVVCDYRFDSKRSYTSANTGSSCLKMTGAAKKYTTVERGAPNSTDYRVFISEYHYPIYLYCFFMILMMCSKVAHWTWN